MSSLAIISNRVITPDGIKRALVLINEGRITEVLTDFTDKQENVIDIGNKVLMAGVIDPHVHINEPGRTDWEGFDTATRAALAGGLTTLVDMPLNSAPVTTSVANLEIKRAATQGQLHTNVGFWGGVVPGNADEIEP